MAEANAIVFVVDDDPSLCEALESLIRSIGLAVQTFASAHEFLRSKRADLPSCLVLDVHLPDLSGLDLQQELVSANVQIPIIFLTGHGDIPTSVRAIKAGALEFLTKPFDDNDLLDAIQRGLARDRHLRQQRTGELQHSFGEMVGASMALREVLKQVEVVAPTQSTVLIQGETGTGKELIARAIHNLSSRASRPFVKLNCAAIPSGLLESELFGHEKGAFTGAIGQKIGRFELANGGTFFLDEVGDIQLELQPKLLRVLQEQDFERLGSTRTQHVDVRLVAATNRNVAHMVTERAFREDLYFRLSVFPIHIPPLRERAEDIPLLVRHFVQRYGERLNKRIEIIPDPIMETFRDYSWPGNIRELQNFIERTMILSSDGVLRPPLAELHQKSNRVSGTLDEAERQHIVRVLEETGWVIGGKEGAAEKLGLKRTTLLSKMERLGIARSHLKERRALFP